MGTPVDRFVEKLMADLNELETKAGCCVYQISIERVEIEIGMHARPKTIISGIRLDMK